MTVDRPAGLPRPPYTLRVADLRVRCPGGEVRFEEEFVLSRGWRLALVGADRVRASALSAVLLGLLDYEGTATLNDVQLSDLGRKDVRGVIGLGADAAILVVDDSATRLLATAGDRTLLFVTCRPAVPGATPLLRRFDEVRALG